MMKEDQMTQNSIDIFLRCKGTEQYNLRARQLFFKLHLPLLPSSYKGCFFPYTILPLAQRALSMYSSLFSSTLPLRPEVAPYLGHSNGSSAVSHYTWVLGLPQSLQPPSISTSSQDMCGHGDVSHVAVLLLLSPSYFCIYLPTHQQCSQTSFPTSFSFLPWPSPCHAAPLQRSPLGSKCCHSFPSCFSLL